MAKRAAGTRWEIKKAEGVPGKPQQGKKEKIKILNVWYLPDTILELLTHMTCSVLTRTVCSKV